MKIGLIIATIEEFEVMFNELSDNNLTLINDKLFKIYHLNIKNNDLFIINSGVGEIRSSAMTQYLITKFDVELIINYGVCGGLKKDLSISNCVIVKDVIHYHFDTSYIDKTPVGYYENYKTNYLLLNIELIDKYIKEKNFKLVRCASGDKFIGNSKEKEELANKYDADICEMELAGITLTCLLNNVKIISIKALSDKLDSNELDYSKFAKIAAKEAFNIVIDILNIIC